MPVEDAINLLLGYGDAVLGDDVAELLDLRDSPYAFVGRYRQIWP